jgi:hypothetical protein
MLENTLCEFPGIKGNDTGHIFKGLGSSGALDIAFTAPGAMPSGFDSNCHGLCQIPLQVIKRMLKAIKLLNRQA